MYTTAQIIRIIWTGLIIISIIMIIKEIYNKYGLTGLMKYIILIITFVSMIRWAENTIEKHKKEEVVIINN